MSEKLTRAALAKMPMTRIGWHEYYADRFNKTGSAQALHLAMWYQLLHLAFGEGAPEDGQ